MDRSFGQEGFAERDWNGGYFQGWARLADGDIASVVFNNDLWSFDSFAADGSSAALRTTGSVRLGLDVLERLIDLAPTRDGGLVMIGDANVANRGEAAAVRRILPDGALDRTFGRKCAQPPPLASSRGGALTRDGGVLVTAWRLLFNAGPPRSDSFVIAYDAAGCLAARPLLLRGLIAAPPVLQGRRSAFVGASYEGGLALIKVRR